MDWRCAAKRVAKALLAAARYAPPRHGKPLWFKMMGAKGRAALHSELGLLGML